ncbi:hypothetical protein [Escherichia coli]|uniref:hypothetical protein n=1 Tax=Escherichia coli TaxID=562 RepID=UPI002FCD17EC
MSQRESRNEQENALHNGLTPVEVGPGNTVQIVRAVSTYTVNAQGVTDVSLLDITSIRTLDYTRKACRERISLRFPREKLSTRTIAKVESELYDVLIKLEEARFWRTWKRTRQSCAFSETGKMQTVSTAWFRRMWFNGLHVFAGRIDMIL